jgi:drug/metabolite transporter (DMT)-like permease
MPVTPSVATPGLYLRLFLVPLFWGGTFIAGRQLATTVPHLSAATGRFLIALAVLWWLARRLEGGLPWLDRRQLGATFLLGATGVFLYNVCFLAALSHFEAGRAALFIALNPIVTALAGWALLRDRLAGLQWFGVLLALSGAVLVIGRGDPWAVLSGAMGAGEWWVMGCVLSWAAYTLIGKVALRGLTPLAATTWAAVWGSLLLGLAALTEADRWTAVMLAPGALFAMAYLGVFGTALGFVWYYQGVQTLGPARTAVFNNLVPVWGVLLGVWLLDERVYPSMLAGGALVITGVLFTNRLLPWRGR